MKGYKRQRLRSYLRVPALRTGLLFAVLSVVVAVAAVWGYWLPSRDRLERAEAQVVALNRAISGTRIRLSLTDRYLALSAEVDQLTAKLEAEVDRSELVERMTGLAATAGTRIVHGANSFGQAREGVVPVLQDLTVEGSYENVRDFLDLVADLETLSLLMSAEFTANPDGTLVRCKMRFMTLVENAS